MGDLPEVPVEAYRTGSEKLARLGALLISLAGGEPLIRPDIVQIVAEVGRWHFPFITTNGWFANEGLAEDLFQAGLWGASISIDYADAGPHDRRRGTPGAFERALAAVESFSRARIHKWQRVNWMAVLRRTTSTYEPMIRKAVTAGVLQVSVRRPQDRRDALRAPR
jgi:MoaA/NifB/PqqE/SkfB family radical SAM enzyme